MNTLYYKIEDCVKDAPLLQSAADILRQGGLVAIPTETVYGLAADALNPQAVANIFKAKGRPQDNPLIVHVCELDMIAPLVKTMPDTLYKLAEAFWPGPLTIILPKSSLVSDVTSGGLDTVAIRMPSHPVARELIRLSECPLAAPSANLSGSPSPTCVQHCIDDLTGRVDAIVDGGACEVGVESTVISLSLSEEPPTLLRPGAVTIRQLEQVLGPIRVNQGVYERLGDGERAISPGMKYKHYSPKAKVTILDGTLEAFAEYVNRAETDAGVLCFEGEQEQIKRTCITYGSSDDGASQAKRLFDALRETDERGFALVYARRPDGDGIGLAVYNRLLRAAGFEVIKL